VALAAGQMEGDGLAPALSPDVDLGREAPARAAERLTPRQRRPGERRRRADERALRSHPQSAGPSRTGPPHQPGPAPPPRGAARSLPCANGKTGSTRSRPGRSARAGHARARPCARSTKSRSGGCGGCGSGDPSRVAQGAEAAPNAATAHPSTRNASRPLDGGAHPTAHPLQTRPSFSPGCRPTVDETCGRLCWLAAERLAVSLVRASPRISWTRGTRSTPDCAMGRRARERAV